ncbi:MAG TPA: hypothetical protein VGX21_04320 [Methylomirabilota bacterium]|jgi:hypothetical protein|nr:hypothetical protein [Methylomirabilota bacterium]
MRACLPDETLVLILSGEGTDPAQGHLAGCPACGARYRKLADDLAVIEHALDGPPPAGARSLGRPRRRWVWAAAAGLAAAVALSAGLRWTTAPGPSGPTGGTAGGVPVLQLTSAGLFSSLEATGMAMAAYEVEFRELQEALEAEFWCEWGDGGCRGQEAALEFADLAAVDG